MAVLQRVSFEPNERLDTPDARALEAFSLNDWRFFLSGFLSATSYVLTGFEISNYATIFTVPGFQVTLNDVVLFHSQATSQAAGFYVFAGTEQNAAVSLSPSATNYIEATLTDASGTPDVRAFWDESANGGAGGEFTDTINTVINLELQVQSNITGFTTGNIPLYKVVTNSSGIVTSVTDCRNLFFRLGTGGNSPNPNNSFSYPNLPDAPHSRLETPNTATSATVSNAPFQGGDKNITNFKQWMDAIMSAIKEVKSTPYWYSPGNATIASAYQNAALTLIDGGNWTQNPPFLSTTGSVTLGSNQLTGLASTAGIVGGNVQTVSGADITNSPATTVVSIVGSTVTMSANAIGTNAAEPVSFARVLPGQLQLSGTSHIHRLGFNNHLTLNAFLIDLQTQPILYVLIPTTDTAVSYGFGNDAATPIVPEAVTSVSTTTISVNTGGNYIAGAGLVLVHGQAFSYTSYTPGTGLFSGVSPDPSGLVQAGDYVYQLDSGGSGYYHYSDHNVIPSVINGVDMGAERVYWLAHFDPGGSSIILRQGSILPGETVAISSSTISNILSYTGMPNAATSNPQYTITATGAKSNETNYNSVPAEDLTSRLSRITTMMADKAQDKTIGLLASGFTKIVNTTSGGNQLLTFTGGGTLTVAMPGSANNGTIGLTNTLTLGPLQAAYFETFRNTSFTISDLTGLTVSNITSVPVDENARIFAYRLSDNNIYLWNGTILPVGDTVTPAELSLEVQQNLNSKLINGGTWSWNSGTSTLTWSSSANIAVPGLADSVNLIASGSAVLNDGDIAWVNINRSGVGGTLAVSTGAESTAALGDEFWVIARRTGANVLVGHSFLLINGESKLLDQGISNQNLTYIGAASEATSSPTYSSTAFITNGDSLTTATGELDARAALQQTIANQQRSMQLISGGNWAWNAGTNTLSWSAQANIAVPGLADSANVIAAGSTTLTDGQVAYVNYNRVGPGGTLTVNTALESAVTLSDNLAILARRVGTTVTVGLHGKMLLQDGESKELGAGLSIQNRGYIGISTEATSVPTYTGPNRTVTQNQSLTAATSSMDTQLDHWFGQFRIQPRLGHADQVTITGVDFSMLDNSVLSQTLSNLVVAFTGSVVDFTTGNVYQSDGVTALGINFTPFTIPVGQFFWYSINAVASTVNAANAITLQILVNAAASANAVSASAPYAAFSSTGKNLGQVQVQNVGGNVTVGTIRQLGVGSGSGGGGSGNVTDIEARAEMKLLDSRYQLLTVADFLHVGQTYTSSATATFDVANSRYNFTTAAQQITTINLLDSNEFLSQFLDIGEVEVDLFYLLGEVDTTPIVNMSRDGGNNFFPVTMGRVGSTDEFNGRVIFGTEGTHVTLASQALTGASLQLNASTIQQLDQAFTLANASTVTSFQLSFTQQGTPAGLVTVQIVKDNAGVPSTSPTDILAAITQSASSLTGTVTFSTTVPLAAGTYHLVIVGSSAYQAGFNAVTAGLSVTAHNPGSAPLAQQYNGTTWSSTGDNLTYSVIGRVLDMRLQIIASSATNWNDPTKAILNGYAVYYNPTISQVASQTAQLEVQQVSGTNNVSTFTLTNFLPDAQFIKVYVVETGQVFKYGAFGLNGMQVVFPANTFSSPGQTYTLHFDQTVGGGFDNTDTNASLLAANHLGSTSGTIDRSLPGRGIILRRPDGTLREITIDNSDNIAIFSVP